MLQVISMGSATGLSVDDWATTSASAYYFTDGELRSDQIDACQPRAIERGREKRSGSLTFQGLGRVLLLRSEESSGGTSPARSTLLRRRRPERAITQSVNNSMLIYFRLFIISLEDLYF